MEKYSIIVGIDFGTSNSVISYFKNGSEILKDGVNTMIPSRVYLGEKMYFGNNIPMSILQLQSSNKLLYENFKSNITNDISGEYNNVIYLYFKYLYSLIKLKFPNDEIECVLTVPSNFNDYQRSIILNNAKRAEINIIRLINEPTAAAFAYGLNVSTKLNDVNILVFDIGGGTFDVSLLEVDENYFEVVDSFGINDLGGNNFTDEIYRYITNNKNITRDNLWKKCNNAKEKLSYLKNAKIEESTISCIINYTNLKDICKNLLDRIKNNDGIINLLNKMDSTNPNNKLIISKILLVGGSSKLLIIQELIESLFKIKPLVHKELQHVVSLGACYYGALIKNRLENFNQIILIDTLPLSLGVETADGLMSVIISKNTPLPATRTQKYTTDTPGDKEVTIKVYQGEKTVASNNSLIGEFIFNKVSKTTNPEINIIFKVDINGIISVSIEDIKSNESVNILIKSKPVDDIDIPDDAIELSNKLDEEESRFMSLAYKIKTKIENLLSNKNICDTIEEYYSNIIDRCDLFTKGEITIPEMVKIDTELDEKYLLLINNSANLDKEFLETSLQEDNLYDIGDIILNDKLETLKSKIDFYLSKELEQFKMECMIDVANKLEKYEENNKITQLFIEEQLTYISELFPENKKNELIDLCIFLKSGIDNKEIPYNEELYNKIIYLLDIKNIPDTIFNEIDYENEINIINELCMKEFNKIIPDTIFNKIDYEN